MCLNYTNLGSIRNNPDASISDQSQDSELSESVSICILFCHLF